MRSLRKIWRVTIGRTWVFIGTGGTHKCVPYAKKHFFGSIPPVIYEQGGTDKSVPYEHILTNSNFSLAAQIKCFKKEPPEHGLFGRKKESNQTGFAMNTLGKFSLSILHTTAAYSKLGMMAKMAEPEPVICMPRAP